MRKIYLPGIALIMLFLFFFTNSVLAQRTPTLGSDQSFGLSDPVYWMRTAMLDETHFIAAFKTGSSPSASAADIYAIVGEVDTTTKSITYGTPTLIESASANRVLVVGISSTQAVIAFEYDVTFDYGAAVVVGISGTTITGIGTPTQFSGGDYTTIEGIHLGSGKVVFVYDDLENSAYGTAVVGDVSGSSITFGTPEVFSSSHTDKPAINAISSSKIIIGFEDDGAIIDDGKVIIADVSGTTFSFGSAATFHSNAAAAAVKEVSVAPLSSGYFIVAFTQDDNSDAGAAIIGTYSGTTAGFPGSKVYFETGYNVIDKDVEQLDEDEFILAWNGSSTANASKIVVGERNGNSITFGTTVTHRTTQADDNRFAILNDDSFVLGYIDDNITDPVRDPGEAIVGTLPSNSTPGLWTGATNTDWATASNWDDGNVPTSTTDVDIPDVTNDPVISASTTAEINNINVQSGASLTIQSTASNNGALIVNGTTSGNVTYNRYLTASNWHLVASPVTGQAISDFSSGYNIATNESKYAIAPYDNSIPGWAHYTSQNIASAGNFSVAKGYEMMLTSAGTLPFTGSLITSDTTITLTTPDSGKKWNLIGNPFTAALNANQNANSTNNFLTVNQTVLETAYKAIYIWDPTADDYITVNQSSPATYIAPGQAFFVYAAESDGDATFSQAMLTNQTGDIFKSGVINYPSITLFAENQDHKKSTHIKYIDGMTTGIDAGYDAARCDAGNNSLAVFTQLVQENTSTAELDIQCLPGNNYDLVIPVGLLSEQSGEVVFSTETTNLPAGTPVYLEDKLTGTTTALHESGSFYQATIAEANESYGRFYIYTKSILTEITDTPVELGLIPQPAYNRIRIIGNTDADCCFSLYDVSGRKLLEKTPDNNNQVSMAGIKTGVYIATLRNNGKTTSKKISWLKN